MKDTDVDRIARNPKFASYKAKPIKKSRTVNELFEDVDKEISYKDKRGRPWLKNPRAYVKQKIKEAKENESEAVDDTDSKFAEITDSSSESSVELDPFESIADLCDADWNELTKDALPATNTGKRLALLHFDWDNAKVENIYMVLESFLPPKGHIERVTIYPSEFGIKRLEEEATKGPPELIASDTSSLDEENEGKQSGFKEESRKLPNGADSASNEIIDVDDKSGWRKASIRLKRRIRRYQLARLKYYYAIIEFDNRETAEAVYNACDGFEYESSGARLDLRFVSDDEVFSVPPEYAHLVSECREINKAKYVPRPFETSALHSTRIGISWDKTPDERTCWLRDQFKPEADPKLALTENRDELEKYLALSSSGASTAASSDVDEPPPAPTVPRIRRHRPKKLPPAELRAALLSALREDCVQPLEEDVIHQSIEMKEEADEVTEEEEEVMDLNDRAGLSSEEYDLGPVEKVAKRSTPAVKQGRRQVPRKVLPEAMDDQLRDDSSDSDPVDPQELEQAPKKKRNKHKEKQRAKMLEKKRLLRERLEKQATLWSDPDSLNTETALDDRFDVFLTDPAFSISQTHPDYKEAIEFLRFMQRRRALMLSTQQQDSTLGC